MKQLTYKEWKVDYADTLFEGTCENCGGIGICECGCCGNDHECGDCDGIGTALFDKKTKLPAFNIWRDKKYKDKKLIEIFN